MSDEGMEDECEDRSEEIEEQVTEDERARIRQKISGMTFEDLQKLKEKIGSKAFNKTVFSPSKKDKVKSFKRVNKNRPREMSSKRRVKLEHKLIPVQKHVPRDPRFDSMCGTFDDKSFKSNYHFVHDLRKKEKDNLERQLKDTTDPDEVKRIKYVVERLNNQIREQEKKDKQKQQEFEEKMEIRQKVTNGEKPHFKKKSVKRIESLIDKYEELKKTNKLQKHIERRSKKLSVKDRRKLEKQNLVP